MSMDAENKKSAGHLVINETTGARTAGCLLRQISSAMMTLAPGTYTLSFDLIGSQRGLTTSTTVMLRSLFNQTFILDSSDVSSGIVNGRNSRWRTYHGSPRFYQQHPGQYWGTSGQRQFRGRVRGNS